MKRLVDNILDKMPEKVLDFLYKSREHFIFFVLVFLFFYSGRYVLLKGANNFWTFFHIALFTVSYSAMLIVAILESY